MNQTCTIQEAHQDVTTRPNETEAMENKTGTTVTTSPVIILTTNTGIAEATLATSSYHSRLNATFYTSDGIYLSWDAP